MLQLTSVQKQRHARKSRQKPEQAELFEPVVLLAPAAKPAEPVTPKATAQSPRAAAVATENEMRATALRVMNNKAAGKVSVKAPKPRPKVLKS